MQSARLFAVAIATMLLVTFPLSASAGPASPAWLPGVTLAPYGWLAGVDGTVGTNSDGLDPGVDPDFPDLLEVSLDGELREIGFMFFGEWRGDRWTLMFDSVWANVQQDADVSIGRWLPASDVTAGIDGNVYTLAGGIRALDWQRSTLTVFGGLRHYDLEVVIDAEGGLLPRPVTASVTKSWDDGVVGARWSHVVGEDWTLSLMADIGVGQSNSSSELSATLGYRFSSVSVLGGFRRLSLDYDDADYALDIALFGPMLGVAWRF